MKPLLIWTFCYWHSFASRLQYASRTWPGSSAAPYKLCGAIYLKATDYCMPQCLNALHHASKSSTHAFFACITLPLPTRRASNCTKSSSPASFPPRIPSLSCWQVPPMLFHEIAKKALTKITAGCRYPAHKQFINENARRHFRKLYL